MTRSMRVTRARATMFLRKQAEKQLHLPVTEMSRRDQARWAACRDLPDLGECVIAWLEGKIIQAPSATAPPDDETIPLIPFLTVANRAGFITDCSQLADAGEWGECQAWVCGFATDGVLSRLRETIQGTPLRLSACCYRQCDCEKFRHIVWGCPRDDAVDLWTERCPAVGDELSHCWYVIIEDPRPCRNDWLWPALEQFATIGQ